MRHHFLLAETCSKVDTRYNLGIFYEYAKLAILLHSVLDSATDRNLNSQALNPKLRCASLETIVQTSHTNHQTHFSRI